MYSILIDLRSTITHHNFIIYSHQEKYLMYLCFCFYNFEYLYYDKLLYEFVISHYIMISYDYFCIFYSFENFDLHSQKSIFIPPLENEWQND